MNQIKRLEIFGFKSFSGRKEITLPNGLNCIMGPNGSGKSNVADAICFALGKSSRKDLRAEKLGDLVFNGGKKLPPSQFAKVTVILDNKNKIFPVEEDELRLTRKVDRDGHSLFRVNGKRQTMEYVKNMLNQANIDPDGYNMVMQGEIEQFIKLSTEDRRKIIEDLSGISIYEDKKHKCLLELDKVNQRMKEARIVLNEKTKHMEELQKEKEQAEKFSEIQHKLRYKKAAKIKKESDIIDSERGAIQKEADSTQEEMDKLISEKAKTTIKIDALSKELEEITKTTETLGSQEQIELNSQIESLRIKISELNNELKTGENELKRIDDRKKQILNDIKLSDGNSTRLKLEREICEKEITELNSKLEKKRDDFSKLNNLDKERVLINAEINKVDKEMISIQSELFVYESKDKDQKNKATLEKDLETKENLLKNMLSKDSNLAIELSNATEKHASLSKQLNNLEGKKEVLLGLLKKGTRAVIQLKESGKIKGIHGLVQDLGKVNEKYSMPLKIAAGARSDAVVVENVETAKQCIEYLRDNKLGYATFLPLDKLKPENVKKEIKGEGIVGYAIDLIKYSPRYEDVFRYVFSDTIVVNNLDSAKTIGINKMRMVTLDGDLIERSGAITGGHRAKETVGFTSEPIDEKIHEIEKDISKTNEELADIESDRSKLDENITKLRNEVFHLESSITSIGDMDVTKFEKLKKIFGEMNSQKKEAEKKLKDLPDKADVSSLDKLNRIVEDLQTKINETKAKDGGLEFKMEVLKNDVERSKGLLKGLEKENVEFTKKGVNSQKDLETTEKKLKTKIEDEQKFHSKLKELYQKRTKIGENKTELEIKRARIEEQTEIIRDQFNNLKLKLAEIHARLEGKKTAMQEFSDVQLGDIRESVQDLEESIKRIEGLIAEFGAVNMRALDVYKKVEVEYNELNKKIETLQSEENEVIQVMSEVEEQKKGAFFETFKHISKNFERVFTILSPNGEGKLIVENEENPFEGGLDIIARPGGKTFISLRAMSGGEKTLTTLAFIFAVQEYIPSPFYIMDEVDAALDRENSERLSYLLSEYSKTSQFIAVTHNDSVLSQADSIYGVHINELGESQIVSVKLPEK